MILCNGAPKSGTHLLLKAVSLFGYSFHGDRIEYDGELRGPTKYLGDLVHGHCIPGFPVDKHILIVRNPRNVLLSWTQMTGDLTEDRIIERIPKVIKNTRPYADWDCFTVRFEELLTEPSEIERIGEYLGRRAAERHFERLWGGTGTFTGKLSNWRDHWTPAVKKAWGVKGKRLERAFGYQPEKEEYIRCPA